MKKSLRVFLFALMTFSPVVAFSQTTHTITVANGTATNNRVPVYGFYADDNQHCQVIYPSTMLEDAATDAEITGSSITGMTFYLPTPANLQWGATFEVKLMEVPGTSLAAFANTSTLGQTVFTGILDGTGSTMTITFNTPYVYGGGNLLLDVSIITTGQYSSYSSSYFFGVATTHNSAWQANNSTSAGDGYQFIPKTTFTYVGNGNVSCYSVRGLTVSATALNSMTLSWTDPNNTGATYSIYNAEDTSLVATGITGTTYTVTGLTPATEYSFYVEANCSATDASLWSSVTGETECTHMSYPYSTGFEDMTPNEVPRCWECLSGDIYVHENTNFSYNSNMCLHFGGTTHNLVVMPLMDTTLAGHQVRFWTRPEMFSSNCGSLQVGYITNILDTTTFVPLQTYSYMEWENSPSEYHNYVVYFFENVPAGARVAFCQNSVWSNYFWFVDDVTLEELDACLHPTNLTMTESTPTSITLSWSDPYNTGATYTLSDYDHGTLFATGITDTTYTVTGLSPNVLVAFKLVANCSATEESFFQVLEARTGCGVVNVPYNEGFEGMPYNEHPLCWTHMSHVDGANNNECFVSSAPYSGNASLKFNYSYATGNVVMLPELNAPTNTLRMRFMHRSESDDSSCGLLEVGYLTDPTDASTFVALDTLHRNPAYSRAIVSYATAPDTARMAFRHVADSTNWYWLVDDVTVEPFPTCGDINNVVLESATENSATVSWNSTNATSYQVIVRQDDTYNWTHDLLTSDTVITIPGLTLDEDYIVQVRGICGAGDSSLWSDPMNIHIGYCAPSPTLIDGNGIANVTFGDDEVVNNSQRPTSSPYYGNYSNLIGSMAAGMPAEVTITYQTGYTYGTIIWIDWNNNMLFEDDEIVYTGTSTNANPTTLTASFLISPTRDTGYYRMRIGGSDSGFDQFISSGSGFHDPCGSHIYSVYHDYTVHITPVPPCQPVSNVTVTDITPTSVTLSWDHVGVATFTIKEGNTTMVSGITGHTYTLYGLTPATYYTLAVEANCLAGDNGDDVPFTFTTLCQGAQPLPFSESFDFNSGTRGCWDYTSNNTANAMGTPSGMGFVENNGVTELRFSSVNEASNYNQSIISPELDATGAQCLKLDVTYRSYTTNDRLIIGYETATGYREWDTTQYFYDSETDYDHIIVYLPNTATKVLVGYAPPVSAYWAYVSNVTVSAAVVDTVHIVSSDPAMGMVLPAGTFVVPQGESITVTASAEPGYHFVAWMNGDEEIGTANPFTYVPTSNMTLTALFAPDIVYYTVRVDFDESKGTVTGAGTYEEGTTVTLTAIPNEGFEFVEWTEGIREYADNPYVFPLEGNRDLVALFHEKDTTAIGDVENTRIRLYPNPASHSVTLAGVAEGSTVTVLDLNGRAVYTNASTQTSNNAVTIDVSGWAQGAYFVRIVDEKNTVVRKLIVK